MADTKKEVAKAVEFVKTISFTPVEGEQKVEEKVEVIFSIYFILAQQGRIFIWIVVFQQEPVGVSKKKKKASGAKANVKSDESVFGYSEWWIDSVSTSVSAHRQSRVGRFFYFRSIKVQKLSSDVAATTEPKAMNEKKKWKKRGAVRQERERDWRNNERQTQGKRREGNAFGVRRWERAPARERER